MVLFGEMQNSFVLQIAMFQKFNHFGRVAGLSKYQYLSFSFIQLVLKRIRDLSWVEIVLHNLTGGESIAGGLCFYLYCFSAILI